MYVLHQATVYVPLVSGTILPSTLESRFRNFRNLLYFKYELEGWQEG